MRPTFDPRRRGAAIAMVIATVCASACASHGAAPPSADTTTTLTFAVDAPPASESYTCFGFDAAPLRGRYLRAIRWSAPPDGPVALHHASLYALSTPFADTPTPCEEMPAAWTMHVWAKGGDPLVLPPDVAIALPPETQRLVIQTHAIRTTASGAANASAAVETTSTVPGHVAAWLGAAGLVPAIRPRMQETSTASCRAATAMHIVSSWPHMHRVGRAFHGAVVRADGSRTAVVDVADWSFDRQATYRVDVDVAAGDSVETRCIWQNDSDAYVLPGLRSGDEMCGQGLVVWPAPAAWSGSCP